MIISIVVSVIILIVLLSGIRIVRPTHRGLIETLGKYSRFADPGFNWIIPIIEHMVQVEITEILVDAEPQEIITSDNLNAKVDAQVYFKIKLDEESVKSSQYNVQNVEYQITSLAQTTLRNIIGGMKLMEANSERGKINKELLMVLQEETQKWGIEIVRTELKEINPPADVQESMNRIVKAGNERQAAIDFATAEETKADGVKRASIKQAEGQAEAIRIVNEAANKHFTGNAVVLRKLETVERTFRDSTKIIMDSKNVVNVLGNLLNGDL